MKTFGEGEKTDLDISLTTMGATGWANQPRIDLLAMVCFGQVIETTRSETWTSELRKTCQVVARWHEANLLTNRLKTYMRVSVGSVYNNAKLSWDAMVAETNISVEELSAADVTSVDTSSHVLHLALALGEAQSSHEVLRGFLEDNSQIVTLHKVTNYCERLNATEGEDSRIYTATDRLQVSIGKVMII